MTMRTKPNPTKIVQIQAAQNEVLLRSQSAISLHCTKVMLCPVIFLKAPHIFKLPLSFLYDVAISRRAQNNLFGNATGIMDVLSTQCTDEVLVGIASAVQAGMVGLCC